MTLIEGLQQEMNRCRELLKEYESIPEGAFGALMIKRDIAAAEHAMATSDVVEMITCLQTLKECQ